MKKLAENFLNLNKIIIAILFITVGFFIGKHASAANTDFTIGVWVKGATTTASRAIAVKNNEIRLATDSAGRPVCQFHNGTAWRPAATSTDALDAGKWYYVACSYSGSAVKVYINGTEKASISDTASVNNTANVLRIGNDAGGTYSDWVGFIDEVKIYPYARSAEEIRADYAAGLAGVGTSQGVSAAFGSKSDSWMSDGLVGYWKMDESATTSGAIDSSGNGLHGTYIGDASTTAGKFGNGGVFDGSGDYTEIANDTSLNYNEGTISGWFKLDNEFNGTSPTSQIIMERYYDNNNHFIVVLSGTDYNDGRGIPDGALIFKVEKAPYNIYGYRYVWTKNTSWDAGVWYHFAVMSKKANGENNKVYINGADDTAGNVGENGPEVDYNSSIRIGGSRSDTAQLSGERYFDGVIDEVRIYNRILSSQEARLLYEWAPGPVAHWKFDEHVSGDGKTVYDSAASSSFSGGNHGTTNDGANNTGMDCSRPGKYGTSCEFDGADDYINAGSKPTVDDIRQMTVTAWIYPETLGEGNSGIILCKGANWGTDGQWAFFLGGNYRIRFMKYFTSNDIYVSSANNSITLNQWQHVALTWTGGGDASEDVSIYVNGNEVSYISQDDATGYKSDAAHNVYIGNSVNSAATFDGLIDDVRIYNYARTQKQILEDMHGGKPGPHPVLHLSFDEGYGGTAYDSSGYGNNGTLFPGTGGTNTATSAMWTMDGKFGKAVEFDGTDDRIMSNFQFSIFNQFSISKFINFQTLAAAKPVVSQWGNSQNAVLIKIDDSNSDELRICVASGLTDNCTNYGYTTDANLQTKQWYGAQIIYDGAQATNAGKLKLYLDGAEKTLSFSGTIPATFPDSTQNLEIGGDTDLAAYANVLIDELKIYPYPLNVEEIKTDLNQGKSTVMGAVSTATTTSATGETVHVPDFAATAEYCVPGSDDYCAPPVGEWTFNEKTGTTTYDTSGNGNDGVFVSPVSSPAWKGSAHCKFGNCLEFDGGDDYVRITNPEPVMDVQYVTLNVWAKSNRSGSAYGSINASLFNRVMAEPGTITLYLSNTTDIMVGHVRLDGSEGTVRAAYADDVLDTDWHFYSLTYDGNNVYLYRDGFRQQSSTAISGTIDIDNPNLAEFGRHPGALNYWDGFIDQVQMFDYARTPAQIAWDYNRGKPRTHYRFDECQSSTIYDFAVSWNGGTANNGQLYLGSSGVTATGTCASSSDSFWYNGRTGHQNSAGSFDGTDDYINAGNVNNLYFFDATFGMWIKTSTAGSSTLFAKADCLGSACADGYWVGLNPAGRLISLINSNGTGYVSLRDDGPVLTDNQWHHVLVTVDRDGNMIRYVDGEQHGLGVDISSVNDSLSSTVDFLIGAKDDADAWLFNGLIDEVKVWIYTLTPEQVRMEYAGGAVRFGE